MTELQTVETLNCLIERTETPPFYRLTSMRKASSHSDGKKLMLRHQVGECFRVLIVFCLFLFFLVIGFSRTCNWCE